VDAQIKFFTRQYNQPESPLPPWMRSADCAPVSIQIEPMGEVCVLRLQGHFRSGEDPQYLRQTMRQITAAGRGKVLVDLEQVPAVGSAGVSFLVGLYRLFHGKMVLVSVQPRVRQVLDIMRLSTLIPAAADLASGLQVLGGEAAEPSKRAASSGML
jgi:anti-anti-sigma factor